MKPLFKSDDFLPAMDGVSKAYQDDAKAIAEIANAKFERWLKRQKKVTGTTNGFDMHFHNYPDWRGATHTARIVDVRKMK